ncbi:Kinase, ULK [Spironucleus salmonicida]|uniref:Kinase, ULK n=1 Tax=Spironucleus salmonicida TaxID=348837 RepID=V6LZG3_9EUKA|nr:Kinase, ULK [Spironucleus salmonicida]|eukprot:EST49146.1 Kinase, ULK [Spironucleus salmonicida]
MYDNYQMISLLGNGSQGSTYEAYDLSSQSKVVLKQITLQSTTEYHKQIVIDECHLISQLKHPFIVQQLDFFQKDNSIYQVQELAEFGDLELQLAKQGGKLSEKVLLTITHHILLGLHYLHQNNIVHRDIKPANVVIMPDKNYKIGRFTICDFGLSRKIKDTTDNLDGTPMFLAPEILYQQQYGFGVDIWALGVLIYKCATGMYPFNGRCKNELYNQIQNAGFHPLTNQLSSEFCNLVTQMLEKNFCNRPTVNIILQNKLFQSRNQYCARYNICDVSQFIDNTFIYQPNLIYNNKKDLLIQKKLNYYKKEKLQNEDLTNKIRDAQNEIKEYLGYEQGTVFIDLINDIKCTVGKTGIQQLTMDKKLIQHGEKLIETMLEKTFH